MISLSSIPSDVLNNHIIPYTYQPQPATLTSHIQSYGRTIPILEDILLHEPAPFAMVSLLSKLYVFLNGVDMIYGTKQRFIDILRRNRGLSTKSDRYVINYLYQNLQFAHQNKQLRFLWGLLTHSEHNDFMTHCL
jgi:hypothetical protein